MNSIRSTALGLALALCTLGSGAARAGDLPAINLGVTSFLDGAPPNGSGLYYTNYTQFFTADRILDNDGDRVALPRQEVDVPVNLFQLIYFSDREFLGGKLGFDVVVPLVFGASVEDGLGKTVLQEKNGFGDLFIGPLLQFEGGEGRFVHRISLPFLVPTGRYDEDAAVSPSSNFLSFNPYWAFTAKISSRLSTSWRLHYLWNARNRDPSTAVKAEFGPEVGSTQAGQAVHANFTLEYKLTDSLFVGLNGYALKQFSDTKIDGDRVRRRREQVWSLGPGLVYLFGAKNVVLINTYFEQDAENRPQGSRFQLRWLHQF